MSRTSVITHKDKPIVHIDVRGEQDVKVSLACFDKARELLSHFPPKSGRLLTDVTGTRYTMEAAQALKTFSSAITPYVKASAAVGIDGLKAIIIRTLVTLTGRNIQIFDDVDKAKDWLATQ